VTLPRSDDPLPANTIRFSEAFELFYRSTEGWEEIEARIADVSDLYDKAPPEAVENMADGRCHQDEVRLPFLGEGPITDRHKLAIARADAIHARETARAAAWNRWRDYLAAGYFDPRIRDPQTGEALCLNKAGWTCDPGWGPRAWVVEDFVCPGDPWQPGPDAKADGYLRPLFFFRDAFVAQLEKLTQPAEQKKRRGTKPKYDRERIQNIVFENMGYHGEFDVADPDWSSSAALERAVLDALSRDGKTPAESTVRKLIVEPLKNWRAKSAAEGR
jgi:hypothetical protein